MLNFPTGIRISERNMDGDHKFFFASTTLQIWLVTGRVETSFVLVEGISTSTRKNNFPLFCEVVGKN